MEIKIVKTSSPKQKPDSKNLGFGKYFTDHMFIMEYSSDHGWHNARIVPFENLSVHPASTVFHYGVEIFEGLKAYRKADGSVQKRLQHLFQSTRTGLRARKEPRFIFVRLCSEMTKA